MNNEHLHPEGRPFTKDEFVEKIKDDNNFSNKWGDLGRIYGAQWRGWNGIDKEAFFNSDNLDERNRDARHGMFYKESEIDQIQNLINNLKTNPDSRRLIVSAWNVGELDQMVLPPCHYGFQVYTRELSRDERYNLMPSITGHSEKNIETRKKINNCEGNIPGVSYHEEWLDSFSIPTRAISLMWNQRSVDTFLGLPFNIASYGLLLEIIAKEVNMVPDQLIGNLGDVHLYSNHIEQAKEQIEREPMKLPTFDCPAIDEIPHTTFDELVFKLQPCDFYMDDYQSHPTIKAPLSN